MAMTYRGRVRNNAIVLERGVSLPNGLEVEVRPVSVRRKRRTLGEELLDFVGIGKGMPRDMALHHDHYLHGRPKK
jgi:hypothetical protein